MKIILLLCASALLTGCTPHDYELRDVKNEVQAAQAPITLPTHLDINGQTWDVQQVTRIDNKGSDGETFCDTREIDYAETDDPVELRDTLWHEIFHAGDCIHGGKDTWWNSSPKDEAGIKNLADFMHNFTRDNKQFIAWAEEE